MPAVPVWLQGTGVTVATLTGQVVAADGTLTDAVTTGIQPLVLKWDSIELENSPELEEISAADTTRANNVIIKESTRMRFSCIMQKAIPAGAGANDKALPLQHMALTYSYIKMVLTRGGVAAEDTWTFYGCRGAFSETLSKGKCIQTLSLEMMDPGVANPAIA